MANRYRKKPVVVEAVQWTGYNYTDLYDFTESAHAWRGEFGSILIPTLEGEMEARRGDWIIKGVRGEFYPCKPDIFEATYELVESVEDQLIAKEIDRQLRILEDDRSKNSTMKHRDEYNERD